MNLPAAALLAALLSAPATLACAQQTDARMESPENAGAALRVAGSAAEGMLNLRAEPEAGAPVVATLAPGTSGIAVVGLAVGSLDWLMVEKEAARGWMEARALAYEGGDTAVALPVRLSCAGTEPFWGLDLGYGVADADLAYAGRQRRLALGPPQPARGRFSPWLLAGASMEDRETFLVIEARGCSDGMSDRIAPFSISARINGAFLSGCCR